MLFHDWLHSFRTPATHRLPKPKRWLILLQLEHLEDRLTPSTLTVTNANDSGDGSLRVAIAQSASGDTINFSSSLQGQTITLTSGELLLNQNVTITGLGSNALTVSGNKASRVFEVAAGVTASISGLTIENGVATSLDPNGAFGGGILDLGGKVTLNNVVVQSNQASGIGTHTGFGNSAGGGGIYVSGGTLTITGSAIRNNTATGGPGGTFAGEGFGGGIAAAQLHPPGSQITIRISNSTISGNTAQGGEGSGGGVDISASTQYGGVINALILNSSITGNLATGGTGQGGGLSNTQGTVTQGTVQLINTTVATNKAHGFTAQGGGVYEDSTNSDMYLNDTIAFNTASAGAGEPTFGGGFFIATAVPPVLINTMLESNTAVTGPDYSGGVNTNSSNNFFTNGTPQLGPATPAPNGTTYYPVLPTSVTVNAGTTSILPIIAAAEGLMPSQASQATDQIGSLRVRNGLTIDIGAAQAELPTTTLVNNVAVPFTNADPEVTLIALVTSPRQNVNEGQIQFTIAGLTSQPLVEPVVNGRASITFGVPPNTPVGNYTIIATFVDSTGNFAPSTGSGVLTVFPSPTTVTINNVSIVYGLFRVQETLTAVVRNAGVPVNEGFVTFTEGGQTVTAPIINGLAMVTLNIPLSAENPFEHTVAIAFGDNTGNLFASQSLFTIRATLLDFLFQLLAIESLLQSFSSQT